MCLFVFKSVGFWATDDVHRALEQAHVWIAIAVHVRVLRLRLSDAGGIASLLTPFALSGHAGSLLQARSMYNHESASVHFPVAVPKG